VIVSQSRSVYVVVSLVLHAMICLCTSLFPFVLSFFFDCYVPHRDLHSFPTRRSSDLYSIVNMENGSHITSYLPSVHQTWHIVKSHSLLHESFVHNAHLPCNSLHLYNEYYQLHYHCTHLR